MVSFEKTLLVFVVLLPIFKFKYCFGKNISHSENEVEVLIADNKMLKNFSNASRYSKVIIFIRFILTLLNRYKLTLVYYQLFFKITVFFM